MSTRKRKTQSGFTWAYYFDLPGSTRQNRRMVSCSGYASKKKAEEAERERHIAEQLKAEAATKGLPAIPQTLGELLDEFCREHGDRNLEAKTVERYRQDGAYLSAELRATPLNEITAVNFTREWNRLRESGGHHRRTREARPLSTKTVRNIAGFVSSAFTRALSWGLVQSNPVTASSRPRGGEKRPSIALTPEQHRLMVDASTHWIVPTILEVCAGLGARRGEVLALRWSDIVGDEVTIGRSLSQTKQTLRFKEPKTAAGYRTLTIPGSTLGVLEQHRVKQLEFRRQFADEYHADLDLIFCNPEGTPLKPDSISSAVSLLCRKLKLPKGASLHTQRHTHGSQLLVGGMEISAVSARLGHSSPHVTAKVYSHILNGRDRKAAEVWDAMQSATSPRQHQEDSGAKEVVGESPGRTNNERLRTN